MTAEDKIQRVRLNLENTIRGKTMYLESTRRSIETLQARGESIAFFESLCEFLVMNIDELQRILDDLK